MNSINSIVTTLFVLMHVSVPNITEAQIAHQITPSNMIKFNLKKTYKPINHDEVATFALWEQKIKASLIKKSNRKSSKK